MPRVIVVLPSQSYRATDFMKAGEELGIDLIVASASEKEPAVASRVALKSEVAVPTR
jgi:hypothetical protein